MLTFNSQGPCWVVCVFCSPSALAAPDMTPYNETEEFKRLSLALASHDKGIRRVRDIRALFVHSNKNISWNNEKLQTRYG